MIIDKCRPWIALFFLISSTAYANHWALTDPNQGWNDPVLVRNYFHDSECQTQWAWHTLSLYHFKGNECVLDFGCGDGKISALISRMVPEGQVEGVDLSKEMIYFASKMFPNSTHTNLNFKNSQDVNFSDANCDKSFDLITSFCVFHLVPFPSQLLANIRQHLKPNGKLIMNWPSSSSPEFIRAALEVMNIHGLAMPPPTAESKKMRNIEEACNILSDAGFSIDYCRIVDTRNPYSTREELVDWLIGTCTANWNIPLNIRREFFEEVTNRYLKYRPDALDEDGFVYFFLKRIDIIASATRTN